MLSSRPGGMRRTFGADRTNHHAPAQSSENHHVTVQKTPGAAAAKTPSRRRALGDISNRKAFGGNANTGNAQKQQQRGVTFTSATKSVSKSVLPGRSSTPYVKNNGSAVTTITTTTATPRVMSFVLPPMDDIEFRAGRPFDPFDGDDEVLDISVDLSIDDDEMLTKSSSMSLKHTPRHWMSAFGNSYQDTMIDDASLMVAPDDVNSFDRIDISLEEEVDFLGVGITDISF